MCERELTKHTNVKLHIDLHRVITMITEQLQKLNNNYDHQTRVKQSVSFFHYYRCLIHFIQTVDNIKKQTLITKYKIYNNNLK